MLLIYLIVNYFYRKYGVPLHNFFENWTRGISHLNCHITVIFFIVIFIHDLNFGHWFCNTEIPLTLTDAIHCYFPKQR